MKKLLIIDGNNFLWRAVCVLRQTITNEECFDVSGAWHCVRMFARLIHEWVPDIAIIVWDGDPVHKKAVLPTYKHYRRINKDPNREHYMHNIAERVRAAILMVQKLCDLIGIINIEIKESEADDIIGALVYETDIFSDDYRRILITNDRDYLHYVDNAIVQFQKQERITVSSKNYSSMLSFLYNLHEYQKFNHHMHKLFHALLGDKSDDVATYKGIGEKTAADVVRLLYQYFPNFYFNTFKKVKNQMLRLLPLSSPTSLDNITWRRGFVGALRTIKKMEREDNFRLLEFNFWFLNPRTWIKKYAKEALLNYVLEVHPFDPVEFNSFFQFLTVPPENYYTLFKGQCERTYQNMEPLFQRI